jgi:hypothetical protein
MLSKYRYIVGFVLLVCVFTFYDVIFSIVHSDMTYFLYVSKTKLKSTELSTTRETNSC